MTILTPLQKRNIRDNYPNESMRNKYLLKGIKKIGILDIETSNLDADFGPMLTYGFKVRDLSSGEEKISSIKMDFVTNSDIEKAHSKGDPATDKRILLGLEKELQKVDLVIGHYAHGWGKFDVPYIRARFEVCKLPMDIFSHKKIFFGDTWKMAHMLYKIHSYRLDSVAELLGIRVKKTPITGKQWQLARAGLKSGLKYVLEHNRRDVQITYLVHKRMENMIDVPKYAV